MGSESTGRTRERRRGGRRGHRGARRLLLALAALSLACLAAPGAALAESTAVLGWGDNFRFDLGAGYLDTAGNPTAVTSLGVSDVGSLLAAGSTSYALLPDETVRAWGGGAKGQLGDGTNRTGPENGPGASTSSPVTVLEQNGAGERGPLGHVKQLAASYGAFTHALALVENPEHEMQVYTWGASEYGERGNGEYGFVAPKEGESHAKVPREVAMATVALKNVVYVAAGGADSFAITEEGGVTKVWGWGVDRGGGLGVVAGTPIGKCGGEANIQPCVLEPAEIAIPELPDGVKVTAVYGGRNATYARLSNGQVLAWGSNEHGQLGNGLGPTASKVPVYVCAVGASAPCGEGERLSGIKEVSGGVMSAIALTEAGTVVGWGSNGDGELGGTAGEECKMAVKACLKVPKAIEGLEHVKQVSEGSSVTVALTEAGTVMSLGNNEHGQLGSGSLIGPETCAAKHPCSRAPVAVAGLSEVAGISAGGYEVGEGHTLAWLASGGGPAPLFTVTPGSGSLTVNWALPLGLFRVTYRTAPQLSEPGELLTWEEGAKVCPCSSTISGLTPGTQYQVNVESLLQLGTVLHTTDTHTVYAIPEP
jgi:alpha-tubulin suppressor-like RCC1 family protein